MSNFNNWHTAKTYCLEDAKETIKPPFCTVGATRLARATALARSLSNTTMEMFYKHFRLEISTD
jgi:hypothetical protein